jgi:hypothetical protein
VIPLFDIHIVNIIAITKLKGCWAFYCGKMWNFYYVFNIFSVELTLYKDRLLG